MGFFDMLKTIARGSIDVMDETAKKVATKMPDEHLLKKLDENPENKYLRAEAKKRGLV
ncbi:hypothetical protein [Caminibacter sp.]